MNEASTDLWVWEMLKEAGIEKNMSPQGSIVKEINEALKTASKSGTGNVGRPEYVGVVQDFVIVIENKRDTASHIKRNTNDIITKDYSSIKNFAVNGALYYGQHIAKETNFKKILAIGVSGNEKHHEITPVFIDERRNYKELPNIETFISFSHSNIQDYYIKEVLEEETDKEKELKLILKDAQDLHEDLRNYGSIQDKDKPLIVSGILLALRETNYGGFSIDSLTGDTTKTDGQKIFDAIENNLSRSNVSPAVKKDKLMSQFSIIKNSVQINEYNKALGKTPLKYYTEFLYNRVYTNIVYSKSSEDILGRFYGEFMSYSGGDGQTLGIVLTPRHITDLFADLLELSPDDKVFDPACGTGGFLVSAMHNMLEQTSVDDTTIRNNIKKNQIHGIEIQNYMFTITTTNMILRGDGKSNVENADFLRENPAKLQLKGFTVGMLNPPYSQGSAKNSDLYEMAFTEHLLNSMVEGGRVAIIVPQSSMTGKTKAEKEIKRSILKKHTLEGVITLNTNTFYNVGVNPCIAIFTAGIKHPNNKKSKFIDFKDDGYEVAKHIGLIETPQAKDKKQYLLDVWFNRIEADNAFCVETEIEADDEWLHSFYYFNEEIPAQHIFETTMANYLSFELDMLLHGREYLFANNSIKIDTKVEKNILYEKKKFKTFIIKDIFNLFTGALVSNDEIKEGDIPRVTATSNNNGIALFTQDMKNKSFRTFDNFISISFLGDVFYHKNKTSLDMKIHGVQPKEKELNKYIASYLIPLMRNFSSKYSYGNQLAMRLLKQQRIRLPINSAGMPDWTYMEEYMKKIEHEQVTKLIEHLN